MINTIGLSLSLTHDNHQVLISLQKLKLQIQERHFSQDSQYYNQPELNSFLLTDQFSN